MKPLTKEFLLNQGKCCKNNCKNCPWKRNKNMENKYYTPDTSDLRVGYEAEISHIDSDIWIPTKWRHNEEVLSTITNLLNYNRRIRTPFLTKEQIENEGWEFNYLGKNDWFKGNIPILPYNEIDYPFELWFKLNKYWLGFYKSIHKIVILEKSDKYSEGESILFKGTIPSINEFRYICKLLNIK